MIVVFCISGLQLKNSCKHHILQRQEKMFCFLTVQDFNNKFSYQLSF